MKSPRCARALRVQRSAKLLKLVELHYAVTDVRSHDKARQGVPETAFVQDIKQ